MLEVKNLTKHFGAKAAVDHIDLKIEKGQLIAFLGHNGAGKSTTINMLTGLLTPDAGSISLEGHQPSENQYTHYLGVVFQDSVLDKQLTVAKNLAIAAKLYRNCDEQFCDSLMQKFEIDRIKNQKYGSLSGGQRRRVDIVRSLLSQPELLFLDEPSTGLDIQTRKKIWEVLAELRQEYGLTIILTTHYLEEANQADWVYVMDKGKIVASDTVDNLKAKYAKNTLTLFFKSESLAQSISLRENDQRAENKVTIKIASYQEALQLINRYQKDIVDFEYVHGTMDDIFIELTGKEIK
ncbi:ABC transporter ATP-binding protein [Apilactobacillus apinorum]|uniref:ABC transporter ATP-binding protein n=1 Tax=Apilactobacillus apinorum TaxID=1218495 RepID=UPI0030E8F880